MHAEALSFYDVSALLAEAFAAAPPRSEVKSELLARIETRPVARDRDRLAAAALPEIEFQFVQDKPFDPTPHRGVSVRVLHVDEVRKQFSAVLRLEPGGVFPSHAHDGPEECLVLEGVLHVGGVRMGVGDFQRTEAGTQHVEQHAPEGALLYIKGPLSLLR